MTALTDIIYFSCIRSKCNKLGSEKQTALALKTPTGVTVNPYTVRRRPLEVGQTLCVYDLTEPPCERC